MDIAVFLVLALITGLLHAILVAYADILGSAIVFAIAGFSCGHVLRTRLTNGVTRMLVPIFFALAFPAAGYLSIMLLFGGSLVDSVGLGAVLWGVAGGLASMVYVDSRWSFAVPMSAIASFGAAGALSNYFLFLTQGDLAFLILPAFACLGALMFDQLCARTELDSPEVGFKRLLPHLEFRLK